MLDRLPREILVLIGEHLDQVYPDSLLDLICVNKHCFSILSILLYRSLKFYVDDLESDQLARDVARYSRVLPQRVGGYGFVRRLIIVHDGDEREWTIFKEQAWAQEQLRLNRHRLTRLERSGRDKDILEEYTFFPGSKTTRNTVHRTNLFWKPLAEFISSLPSLQSIIYNSHTQFPPCLLDAIHQHQPLCRIFVTRFHLWSLGAWGPEDEYESVLLSSPCLHAIGVHIEGSYGGRPSGTWANMYTPIALRELIAGVIPHLKKLVLFLDPVPFDFDSQPSQPWVGFGQQSKARGSLDYLSIHDEALFVERQFKSLHEDTDFTTLKVLKIPSMDLKTVEYLIANCHFPILTQLDIDLAPTHYHSVCDNYFPAVNSFLLGLPALSVLHLSKWHSDLGMKAILEHHGSRLYELFLSPSTGVTATLEDLKDVARYCPLLENLSIKIKRSKGDVQEVAIYKTIGALPRLQHLYLDLDASDWNLLPAHDSLRKSFVTRNDPTFDAFDQQYCDQFFEYSSQCPRNGHLKDAFINSALDDELARSIFHTISSVRTSCFMLESLEVKVTGAGCFSWNAIDMEEREFCDVLETMGRPRRVSQVNSSGNRGCEIKVGLVKGWRPYGRISEPSELAPFAKEIFQRIWPAKTENWWEDWHSFPLAESDE